MLKLLSSVSLRVTTATSKSTASSAIATTTMRHISTKPLPPLPVPSLDQTLATYKKSILPYYPKGKNDPGFRKYEAIIDDFAATQGPQLQARLESFAQGKRNWLAEYWDNLAYLEYRDPVAPFVSYFYAHKDLNTTIGKDQLLKATGLTYHTLRFMTQIEDGSLPPDMTKAGPLCMDSFKWMFNNSRIPNDTRDLTLRFNPKENRFMIVISNGHFYKFYHHDENDQLLSLNELYSGLAAIQADSYNQPKPKNPIGILSSSHRDKWSDNYNELVKNPINAISLNDLASSSFALCLDDTFPTTFEQRSKNFWYGNGVNRWYDKPVQFIVGKNGVSGFLGEHSKMDGTATTKMNNFVSDQISQTTLADFNDLSSSSTGNDIVFEQLKFEINPHISKEIAEELNTFNETVNSLDIHSWHHFGIGKNEIKKFKVSPDAFMQMLFQLAYFKYTGTLRPTYEPASTRKFFGGRTEACRSVSPEAFEFVKLWENPEVPNQVKIDAFRKAISQHVGYISQSSNGNGIDRHLLGLSQMLKLNENKHPFFLDSMFGYSSYWYISTSNLSSEEFITWGFSPVVPEGFGLGYIVNGDFVHVNVTVFKDNQMGLKADAMGYYLTLAANELKEILSLDVPVKAKL